MGYFAALEVGERRRRNGSAQGVQYSDDVDEFFIISGDLACYVIPLEAVGGLRGQEALYASSWFRTITTEVYG